MAWIRKVEPADAGGLLRSLYEQIRTPDGHVDQILKVHSLRPRTLQAHLAIYKAVLHSRPNGMSPREREIVGVCVSALNGCTYCVQHHRAALARHVGGVDLAARLTSAAVRDDGADPLTDRERAFCRYARKLTRTPGTMAAEDLEPLREAGLDDAAILDLNQIVAYFAYANRTVQGLGVTAGDEPLGLHPDDNADGYRHS